jgi:tripartite-type tricarboxylate transporter receptor subunit TctC
MAASLSNPRTRDRATDLSPRHRVKSREQPAGDAAPLRSGARRSALQAASALALGALGTAGAATESPLRLLVSHPRRSPLEAAARLIAEQMGAADGGPPVAVEALVGENGNRAARALLSRPHDGSTVLITLDATVTVNPLALLDAAVPPAALTPLCMLARKPSLLVVSPALGLPSLEAFVEAARQRLLLYASAGRGTPGHLSMAYFGARAPLRLRHSPFMGAMPSMLGVVRGQADVSFGGLANVLPFVQRGDLVALATSGPQRAPQLPSVPTIEESGFGGFEVVTAYVAMVPADTPPERRRALAARLLAALGEPRVSSALAQLGLAPSPMQAEQASAWLEARQRGWAEIVARHRLLDG